MDLQGANDPGWAGSPWPAPARLALAEAVVDASDDAVFSLDPDGRVTSWNRSSERIFGYPAGEVTGRASSMLFPAHLRPQVVAVLAAVAGGDQVDHFETEIQRRDGMPAPVSLSARPVVDAEGRAVASAVIARDITEQRLAQATLAEIEARVRDSEALAHAGGWLWDLGTGTVQWTDELHRIHGIDPLDFDGTLESHLATVHSDDRGRVRAAMRSCVTSGRPFEEEYRVVRPSGDIRWLHARAVPTVGSAGAVVGLRGIGQDVTDRRISRPARPRDGAAP
jgi:PAS domain S-box-containing protein